MNLLQLLTSSVVKFPLEDYQKKLKNCAQKPQVKHASTVMEPSNLVHILVKLIDAADKTNRKIRILDPSLEINNVASKLESQNLSAEFYDPRSCLHK